MTFYMTSLRVIKAKYGDGFVFQTARGEKSFTMVIDGGPSGATFEFRDILNNEYPKIDMIVLTHYDNDHIVALSDYLVYNRERALTVGKYWLNLPQFISMPNPSSEVGYDDALNLQEFMEKLEADASIKIFWREPVTVKTTYSDDNELVKLTAISPTEISLRDNFEAFSRKEAERLEKEGKILLIAADKDDKKETDSNEDQSFENLLNKKAAKDKSLTNKASIAFICEVWDGTKILFSGDATADTMYEALDDMKYTPDNPLEVDLFKLPHHGSKSNISLELLSLVKTNNYLITTNGSRYHHPDRETLAKIILNPYRKMDETVNIYLNYSLSDLRRGHPDLISDEEIDNKEYNFRIIENKTLFEF